MVHNEKELADAIMDGVSTIYLDSELNAVVSKIKVTDDLAWSSMTTAFLASSFFWSSATMSGFQTLLSLPIVLTSCGGSGGFVLITLGAEGTMCVFNLLSHAKTMDVLTRLRNDYNLSMCKLLRK